MFDDDYTTQLFSYKDKKLDVQGQEIGSGPLGTVQGYGDLRNPQKPPGHVIKLLYSKNIKEFQVLFRSVFLNSNHDSPLILSASNAYVDDFKPKGFKIAIKYPKMKSSLEEVIQNLKKASGKKGANSYLPKAKILEYLYSIALGLDYLKKKRISHQNLKPTNVLFDFEGHIKLMDIGLAQEYIQNDTASFIIGKRGPEFFKAFETFLTPRLEHKKDFYSADIWSLGMIILELCVINAPAITPFTDPDKRDKIVKQCLEEIKGRYGEDFASLLESMLRVDPGKRITVSEVIETLKTNYPDIKVIFPYEVFLNK